jgi:hypothetical protein
MLLARDLPPLRHGGRAADTIAGLIGGVMGGLAGLTGPVPTLWCTLRRWDKDVQRSVFQSFRRLVLGLLLVSGCVLVGSSLVG